MRFPEHVAIIMDGNGRWAKEKGLPRTAGHREGVKRVQEILRDAHGLGVKFVTLFAFSTENWTRPKREVQMLMHFLDSFLDKQVEEMHKNNVRFLVIGEREPISAKLLKRIAQAQEKTAGNTGLTAILALNYGSRQEMLAACRAFARDVERGSAAPDDLTEKMFSRYLYTRDIPDPDLLIRTSGELRISNFLLWQLSYAELYFTKKYWPDFRTRDLSAAIEDFQGRQRRFGNIC
jgi:undecaprenyl diphosphate synthase